MSKAIIWILTGIGFFLIILGLIFGKGILVLGFAAIAIGLYLGLGPDGILRKDQVLDTWSVLIEKAHDKGAEILKNTEEFIRSSKAPAVGIENKEISPNIVTGFMGKKRDFLIISDQENSKLYPYKFYLNARGYGDNLDVSWYLTFKPNLLQSIASLLPYVNSIPATLSDLDLFDQQDLRAYGTNAHHCVLKAVDKLMLSLQQDPNKISRQTRGFLGIS